MPLPYENATAGDKAMADIQKMLPNMESKD